MNDNEIIKHLKDYAGAPSQTELIATIALKLINRQKAEIERLKGVIVPPVKVGDPIWRIYTWNGEHIVEGKISMIKQKADFTWKFRGIGKDLKEVKILTLRI